MTKYHARKTVINNITFDSKTQAERYAELCLLQKAGIIRDLRCEPQFTLLEAFTRWDGKRERAITYTADFAYTEVETGAACVEEVKSKATAKARDYSLRRKLFMSKFRQIKFVEVIR